KIRLVCADGTVDPTVYDVAGHGLQSGGLGLNNDATKVYYTQVATLNQPLRTWNLLTNTPDLDLIAAGATEQMLKDTLVLEDGTIGSPRVHSGDLHFIAKRVDDTGALLTSYDWGQTSVGQAADNRIASDINDPTFFWAWLKPFADPGKSTFNKVTT